MPLSSSFRRPLHLLLPLYAALFLSACGGGVSSDSTAQVPQLSAQALLGQQIFRDKSLSASGQMACASCHDPATGHASPFATPVAFGGTTLDQQGLRNPPTLRYLRFNGGFRIEPDGTPKGGFFWDGRAASLQEQAKAPFLNAREMANGDAATVVAKLASAPYAVQFRKVFGDDIFQQPDVAFERAAFAVQRYQQEDNDFAPFSSKFDAFTAGQAQFTAQELRGLAWFNRADKGNCAACHSSTKPSNAPGALFTDFSYDSLGVPRNPGIAANADAAFFDVGLCGPNRSDLSARTDLCGAFKVPTLRNVALRKRFFHNGAFSSLEQVIRFYVQRDTNPERWYSMDALGNPVPYDDLPPALRVNVNRSEGPYNRSAIDGPALNDSEIDDLAAFLQTLTDGWTP